MSGPVLGFIFGFIVCLCWVASSIHGDGDACRAAHPGYDCNVGWVVGKPFK